MLKKLKTYMLYSFLKIALARLQSSSPKFYKDLRIITAILGSLALTIVGLISHGTIPNINIGGEPLLVICKGIVGFIGGIFGTTFLGSNDPQINQAVSADDLKKN